MGAGSGPDAAEESELAAAEVEAGGVTPGWQEGMDAEGVEADSERRSCC